MDADRKRPTEITAPQAAAGPALQADESGTFRWPWPGELLPIPLPTTALDGLLRHLEIDGEFSDWRSATMHLAQACSIWRRLEQALIDHAGRSQARGVSKAARELSKSLEDAGQAVLSGLGHDVARLARHAIAQVATIERVFE